MVLVEPMALAAAVVLVVVVARAGRDADADADGEREERKVLSSEGRWETVGSGRSGIGVGFISWSLLNHQFC